MTVTALKEGETRPRIALLLPGGGARSAYQVGVLRGIASFLPRGAPLPFAVLCGTSAGAINVAVIGAHGPDMHRATEELARVWAGFHIGDVFRADTLAMLGSGLHLSLALLSGGLLLPMPRALMDNSPLRRLLVRSVDFESLRRALAAGRPESIAITATSITGGESVTFVESGRTLRPWEHSGRRGILVRLDVDHLMASAAIPLLFPTVAMGGAHYSDGAIRQSTPLAPAIHLGADRILVIGVRRRGAVERAATPPNMAEQFGFMLDSMFAEGLAADLERLARVNALLARVRAGPVPHDMRHVETLLIQPDSDLVHTALKHRSSVPRSLHALLRVLGARGQRGGRLLSYLLFESAYTRDLIAAGERDARARRDEITTFLGWDRAQGVAID